MTESCPSDPIMTGSPLIMSLGMIRFRDPIMIDRIMTLLFLTFAAVGS